MTDYSQMTDEQVNEAILLKKGWQHHQRSIGWSILYEWESPTGRICAPEELPDYIQDWSLAGKLLEEMGNAISDGWEFSCEHSDVDGLEPLKWRVWMTRFTDNVEDFMSIHAEGDDFIRTVDEAWLAWKEATDAD